MPITQTPLSQHFFLKIIKAPQREILHGFFLSIYHVLSHSIMSSSLWPPGLEHARLLCPSPTPRACSNSCPLSRRYHPTISSPVVPFSSCLQSFTASGSFLRSQFFTSGGQSIGVSASVLPMNIQIWSPLGLTGLISLQSKVSLKSLLQYHSSKASILGLSAFLRVQVSHPYMTTEKNHKLWLDTHLSAK